MTDPFIANFQRRRGERKTSFLLYAEGPKKGGEEYQPLNLAKQKRKKGYLGLITEMDREKEEKRELYLLLPYTTTGKPNEKRNALTPWN